MKAAFTFKKTGLKVIFTNKTTGSPVSLSWDFGDSNTNLIDENPEHTYESEGFFLVKLTAVFDNPEPDGDPIESIAIHQIGVADVTFTPLDKNISELSIIYLPSNMDPLGLPSLGDLIIKWQLFLQPLVNPEIEIDKVFVETVWPPLVNYFIAQLAAYDLIVTGANQYLIGMSSTSGSDSTGSAGEVKSVKTGPAEVEWFQGSETWSEVFKQGGTFDQLTTQICTMAHRLRIALQMCRPLSHSPVPPQIHKVASTPFYLSIFDKSRL